MDAKEFFAALAQWIPKSNLEGWVIFLELLLFLFLGLVCSILSIYMAIAVGNISSRHKAALGIGVFVGTGIIQQVVYSLGITLGIRSTWDLWKNVPDNTFPTWPIHGFLLGHIAYLLLFSALFYMVISWVLKKKLNLS